MAASEFGTGKSIVVLAIVVGCFAILWPKIFYPMMQAAFSMTSPNIEGDEQSFRPRDRPPHIQTARREEHHSIPQDAGFAGQPIKEGRPFPHPSSRQPVKPQSKTGGAMSIIMPIYTIGIVVFFVYTVMKLVFKKPPENDKKPLVKDFHMDPEYHKFVCQQPLSETRPTGKSKMKSQEQKKPFDQTFSEKTGNFDEKDYEIYKLRKKLEETESAMERIMQQMGAVSETLSKACLMKDESSLLNEVKESLAETAQSLSLSSAKLAEPITTNKNSKQKRKNSSRNGKSRVKVAEHESHSQPVGDDVDHSENVLDAEAECDLEKPPEGLDKQLKRDSSINSETSSFEILSQSVNENSSIIADLDSENAGVNNVAKGESEGDTDSKSFDSEDESSEEDDQLCENPDSPECDLPKDKVKTCCLGSKCKKPEEQEEELKS